jgi:hypothetical protein
MAKASFSHFEVLLGTSVDREFSLNLDFLGFGAEELLDLELAFSEEVVREVVGRLPQGKAPWPASFTLDFLQSCSKTVKSDVMAAFNKLFMMCGCSFHGLC